jgi:hypothetical protein
VHSLERLPAHICSRRLRRIVFISTLGQARATSRRLLPT